MPTTVPPTIRRPRLVRAARLGGFDDPAPRPPAVDDHPALRWGRPAVLPFSSVMRVETDDPVVSLTYDDGPEPGSTEEILDVLAERGAKATFFVLSDRAQAHPEIVRRILDEGHEIGLHGIDHSPLLALPGREALRRIRVAKQRVEAVTGRPLRLFRPTYGAIGMLPFVGTRLLGMDVVIWTAWARDWADAPAAELADRVLTAVHPGAVVLLHDVTDDRQALEAGPPPAFSRGEVTRLILDGLAAAGYGCLTTGDLLARYPAVRSPTVARPKLPFRR